MSLNAVLAETAVVAATANAAYAALEASRYFNAAGAAFEALAATADSGNNNPDLPYGGTTAATVNSAGITSDDKDLNKEPSPELITVEIHPYVGTANNNVREQEFYNSMDDSLHLEYVVSNPESIIGNTDDEIVMLLPDDGRFVQKKRMIHHTTDTSAAGACDLIPQKKQKMAEQDTESSSEDEIMAEATVSVDPNIGKAKKGGILWSFEEREILADSLCNIEKYRDKYREELEKQKLGLGKWVICQRRFQDLKYQYRTAKQCEKQAAHMSSKSIDELTDPEKEFRLQLDQAKYIHGRWKCSPTKKNTSSTDNEQTKSVGTRWSYEERQYLAHVLCNLEDYRRCYREEPLKLIGSTSKWNVCSRAFEDRNYNRNASQCRCQAKHMAQQKFENLIDVQGEYRLSEEYAKRIIKKDHR